MPCASRGRSVALGASLALAVAVRAAQGDAWRLADGAGVHPDWRGPVPAASDIVFSTRFRRDDAVAVAREFGATRIEWTYAADADYLRQLHEVAPWIGGAVNANGPLLDDAGYARDFDGRVLGAPWMKGWNGRWITTQAAPARAELERQVQRFVDLGVRSIQVDDPLLQLFPGLFQGGDFNDATVAGFPRYLKETAEPAAVAAAGLARFEGDYREFLRRHHGVVDAADYERRSRGFPSTRLWLDYLRDSVAQHHAWLRDRLHRDGVALSMNLVQMTLPDAGDRSWFLTLYLDYAVAETPNTDYSALLSKTATLRALGIGFVPSIQPQSLAVNRVALATAYALGAPPLVPWDTYVGNDDRGLARRYFGQPAELADIYRFARANRQALDRHELDAVVGLVVPVDRVRPAALKGLIDRLVARQVPFAFVPAGGSPRAPAVDASRLDGFRVLVLTHPEGDYDPPTRAALARSHARRLTPGQLEGDLLADLQPFRPQPGDESLRLVPRSVPGSDDIALHVVDPGRGEPVAGDTACRRRLEVPDGALGAARVTAASWSSGAGRRPLRLERAGPATQIILDDCPLWGIVLLRLAS